MDKRFTTGMSMAFLSMLALPSHAISFFDPVDKQFDIGSYLAENAYGFLPVPMIITEPAVGYGGGIVGVFLHESAEEKEARKQKALESFDGGAQLMPAGVTAVGVAGTQNGTWLAFAGHRHSWLNDSIRYIGGAGGGRFNIDIYSDLGGLLPSDRAISFGTETEGVAIYQHLQFRVAKTPLFLGVKQIWSYTSLSSDNRIVDAILRNTVGETMNNSGLALHAEYDTRNNLFFPKTGYQASAEYMVYNEALGGDYNYQILRLDGQVFVPITEQWTIAFAANYQDFSTNEHSLPPTSRPYIELRGAPSFRYQGDQIAAGQTQVNYFITPRWTISGFYGLGYAKEESLRTSSQTIDAYGVGFRYQLARRYGIHMGVDLAASEDDKAFYISMGSGF